MFDPQKLFELLGDMQEKLKNAQEQNKEQEFTSLSGGGLVRVSVNGEGEIIDINLDDSLLGDKESLQILLISAINDALKKLEDGRKQSALSLFGNLGGFDINSKGH